MSAFHCKEFKYTVLLYNNRICLQNVNFALSHKSCAIHFPLAYKTFVFPLETLLLIATFLCSFANALDSLQNFSVPPINFPWAWRCIPVTFCITLQNLCTLSLKFCAPPGNFTNALRSANKVWIVFCKTFVFIHKCFVFG